MARAVEERRRRRRKHLGKEHPAVALSKEKKKKSHTSKQLLSGEASYLPRSSLEIQCYLNTVIPTIDTLCVFNQY